MSVIIYARVSTGQQAEKELSIPAQLRALKAFAAERRWQIVGAFQDVASGWTLGERPGLSAAIRLARESGVVEHLLVHKADRLSRNTYQYLTIKGQLRGFGVNIVSVVEHFEDNPMGEFMEHIMAAQAEFYSANLSFEVKKGLEERRRQGKWSGPLPLGYIKDNDRVRLDPARADHVRFAFERWATGQVTADALAHELFERGLVGRHGMRLAGTKLCYLLKNPFYTGMMRTASGEYPGLHPHLVNAGIFSRCQEIFAQKGNRGKARKHLCFILTGLTHCPLCDATLVGEQHTKKTGKVYRYYRCHQTGCSFTTRAEALEDEVRRQVLDLHLDEHLLPVLRRRLRQARRQLDERKAAEVRELRKRARDLDDDQVRLARRLADGLIDPAEFDSQRRELTDAQHLIRWTLSRNERLATADPQLVEQIDLLQSLPKVLIAHDVVEQRRVLRWLLARVEMRERPKILVHEKWKLTPEVRITNRQTTPPEIPGVPTPMPETEQK